MARNCNCAGQSCGCLVTGGSGIQVAGQGTAANPFVITNIASDLASSFTVSDTSTLDLVLTGGGTNVDPFILQGNVTLLLQQLSDVNSPGGNPTAGQVPTYVGVSGAGGHWEFAVPTAATVPDTFVFSRTGTIAVSTGTTRMYNDIGRSRTVTAMRAALGTAPTGSGATFQFKKNGANFGSPITVAAGSNTQLAAGLSLAWADTEYLTLDITAIGSTVAGSDAVLTVIAT